MLTPIREWAEIKLDGAISKSSKSRYTVLLNTLDSYDKQCVNGVSEDLTL